MDSIASIFKNNSVILGVDYSENPECVGTFFPTEEEILLINQGFDYDIKSGTFLKGERAISLELQQYSKRIPEILEEMGKLKQQKEGLEMMNENTSEIDRKIEELKNEYIMTKQSEQALQNSVQ